MANGANGFDPIKTLRLDFHRKSAKMAVILRISACIMDDVAADSQGDVSNATDAHAVSSGVSKGHRKADDVWDHFKKKKLAPEVAAKQHRNYDAVCKACKIDVAGKPEKTTAHTGTHQFHASWQLRMLSLEAVTKPQHVLCASHRRKLGTS